MTAAMNEPTFDWASTLGELPIPFGPPSLPVTDVSYYVYTSPVLGKLFLAADLQGVLVSSAFVNTPTAEDRVLTKIVKQISPRALRRRDVFDQAITELEEYLGGRRQRFDVLVDLQLATPFQREVLEDVRKTLPYGHTTSYSEIAAHIDRPKARRAVGTALGANPVCVFVPCHRVLGAGGTLSGYAGGLSTKRSLLELEGIVAA